MSHEACPAAEQQWLCCPDCLTIQHLSQEGGRCFHCQLDLAWIGNVDEVAKSVATLAERERELCLHTRWPGGEAESRCPAGSPRRFMAGDQDGSIDWDDNGRCVRIGLGGQTTRVYLPGEACLGHAQIRLREVVSHIPSAPSMPIEHPPLWSKSVSLDQANPLIIGRSSQCQVPVLCDKVAMQHCMIVRRPNGNGQCWIVHLGAAVGTFVNGRSVLTHRLETGDLVQVGPRAWQYSAADEFLVPVGPISGLSLVLEAIAVGNRLGPLTVRIPTGRLAAVIGPSGAGKSTLVRAILGSVTLSAGQILADGQNVNEVRPWFRRQLGYVPQGQVVHSQLTARETVEFASCFRQDGGGSDREPQLEDILRSVGLPISTWGNRVETLSGGEMRRLQTAAELVNEPRLLILDEPTSGLDADREVELLRLVKSLCRRGGTVLVVTHSHHLEMFDQVIRLKDGCLDAEQPAMAELVGATSGDPSRLDRRLEENRSEANRNGRRQKVREIWTHLRREVALFKADWCWRIALPLFLVPALFASCLSFAVQLPTDRDLLGFLAVLSSIWMGASLGLLSIVDEREIVEHERLVFLHIGPYILAKTVALFLGAAFQIAVFFPALWMFCCLDGTSDVLYDRWQYLIWLIGVAWAAVGVGMFLSALAGLSRKAANFMLPLVMFAQIVFSVEVAGNGDRKVTESYRSFSPLSPGGVHTNAKADRPVAASYISYLTISRYGDIALRSFSNDDVAFQSSGQPENTRWRREAGIGLASFALALPIVAGLWLWLCPIERDSTNRPRLLRQWFRTAMFCRPKVMASFSRICSRQHRDLTPPT